MIAWWWLIVVCVCAVFAALLALSCRERAEDDAAARVLDEGQD